MAPRGRPARKRIAARASMENFDDVSENNEKSDEKNNKQDAQLNHSNDEKIDDNIKGVKRKRGGKRNVSVENPKKIALLNESRGSSDRENEVTTTKARPKRKPLYSTDYINDLEGTKMRCSICDDFVTTEVHEAKEHLRCAHYFCARINNNSPFTMKEIRSALLLASRSLPDGRFKCVCGKVALSPQTFGLHLQRCEKHKVKLLLEPEEKAEISDTVVHIEQQQQGPMLVNGKPRRKSAVKAAITFSKLAQEDENEGGDEDRNRQFDSEDAVKEGENGDADFKLSDDAESSESEEEYEHEVDDEFLFDDTTKGKGTLSTTKSLEAILMNFNGKYRNPIAVPIPDEERLRWKTSLQRHGRIKCLTCGVSYTTSPGIEYHYQRCDKIDFGFKCLKCGICFSRSSHRQLLNHLSLCYDMATPKLDTIGRGRLKASKSHSFSYQDYQAFSEKYNNVRHKVHVGWRYKSTMWPQCEAEQGLEHLSALSTSPLIKLSGRSPRTLQTFECFEDEKSQHNTVYVGGAIWSVKWVPVDEIDNVDANQYFMTVSHSQGSQPEFMTAKTDQTTNGSLSLWKCDKNGNQIERCYTICHRWGFVARVEFCPSRAITENRLALLAATSQSGFVRVLALPHSNETNSGAFYIDPIPVAFLEPAEVSGSLCLAWDPLRDHAAMLVGYANGSVDLFTLKQKTLLVTEDDAFECSKHIGDHGMAVTAVQWHMVEDRRLAVSVGLDPHVMIWDIDQGVLLGSYSRSMSRDMKTLQFVPSVVTTYEESVSINPCVVVHESGAYRRGDPTVMHYTSATPFSIDVNHWRHMLVTADSAGRVNMYWLTNGPKIHNFKSRNLHIDLYEVKQTFPEGVDTVNEEVAHREGVIEFKDYLPSWDKPITSAAKLCPPSRLEYPLNAVLSVAFNQNMGYDHLVLSGLRCGIVRISKVKYKTTCYSETMK